MSNNIYVSINKIMEKCDGLTKDRTSNGGFKYRGIDDMYNYLHDLFVEEGVFSVPRVLELQREERTSNQGRTLIYTLVTVEYTFYATDGTTVTATVVGEAFDTGDKSASKALAIAHKYALFQITMLPTLLSDPDAEVHEVAEKVKKKAMATADQLALIAEYRDAGATTGEQNDWLDANETTMTERQAANILTKLNKLGSDE
jgi:hypothetical protein